MTTLKKLLYVFSIVTLFMLAPEKKANAQIFTGGEFSVNLLQNITVDIAPIVGYKIQNFRIGVSPVIMYTATGNTTGDLSYGGRVFAEYEIYKGFFAHAECEAMNTGSYDWTALKIQRNWFIGAPVGVGYEKELMKGVWLKTMVLYDPFLDLDLNQSSAKANPSIRGGIIYQL